MASHLAPFHGPSRTHSQVCSVGSSTPSRSYSAGPPEIVLVFVFCLELGPRVPLVIKQQTPRARRGPVESRGALVGAGVLLVGRRGCKLPDSPPVPPRPDLLFSTCRRGPRRRQTPSLRPRGPGGIVTSSSDSQTRGPAFPREVRVRRFHKSVIM